MSELIFVLSPYSHRWKAVEQFRYEAVTHFIAMRMQLFPSVTAYSPIAYWHPIAKKHSLPTNADFYAEHSRLMLRLCDRVELLMLDGWEDSHGIQKIELPYAAELGKAVKYIKPTEEIQEMARRLS